MSDPQQANAAALSLFNEVRAAFAFAPLTAADLDAQTTHELLEAAPLLTMLVGVLRANTSTEKRQDVAHSWNKALRRRGWSTLPSLDARAPSPSACNPPRAIHADAVRELLACFGCTADTRDSSAESLAIAHPLCVELRREVEALRTLPLAAPVQYAGRFVAIVERWNAFAEQRNDLPLISS